MALVKTSNEIESIRGRFGGVYFKKDRYGQHIQAMPRSVRKASMTEPIIHYAGSHGNRAANIQGFSFITGLWLLALIAFCSLAWAAYALAYYFTTHTGERKKITGYNWYIFYGMQFPETERPPFWEPPRAPGELPDQICLFEGMWTYDHAPGQHPEYSPYGYYWYAQEFNGKPAYDRTDLGYALWWNGNHWVLSTDFGIEVPYYTYYSMGTEIWDRYYSPYHKRYAKVYIGKAAE